MKFKNYFSAYLFLILTFSSFVKLKSQNYTPTPPLPPIITPDAASFMKFIDNQVSLFNGSVDVSIPIYTVKDGDVEIPITLRYSTSGIKVNEEASWVGLGWNLNVGGTIIQVVEGMPDMNLGYYEELLDPTVKLPKHCDKYSSIFEECCLGMAGNMYYDPPQANGEVYVVGSGQREELKPDVYYYSFLNYSGKFYIDPTTNNIYPLDRGSNVKFELLRDQYLKYFWKAISPDGTVFYFYKSTSTNRPNGSAILSARNFYLTDIISTDGEKVTFSYTNDQSKNYSFLPCSYYLSPMGNNNNSLPVMISSSYDAVSLDKIETPNFTISFNKNDFTTDLRQDLPKERKLNSIVIKDKNNLIERKFNFTYDYFVSIPEGNYFSINDPDITISNLCRRLRLTSFGEDGLNPYKFYYIDGLPIKTSYAVDYWGFYNGEINNNTLLPMLTKMYPEGFELPEFLQSLGGCRASNPNYTSVGLLKNIYYPTGGYRWIVYQSNTFGNYFIPSIDQLNNLSYDVSKYERITDYNNPLENTSYKFEISQPTKIRITGIINRGIGTYEDVKDAYVELRNYTTLIKRWDLSGQYDLNYLDIEYETVLNPSSSNSNLNNFSVNVYINNSLGFQDGCCTKHISACANIVLNSTFVNNYNYSYGGGVRVKEERFFDKNGSHPSMIYSYDYGEGNDLTGYTTGNLMTPLKFYNNYYKCLYSGDRFSDDFEIVSNNKFPENKYSNGAVVGYTNVTVHKEGLATWYTGNSTYDVGKTISYFSVQANDTYNLTGYVDGAPLWCQPLNGKLYLKEVYDNDQTLIKKEEYKYSYDISPNCILGMHVISHDRGGAGGSFYGVGCVYPIKSFLTKLDRYTVYEPNNIVIDHYYNYNSFGQLINDSIKNSDNSLQETSYKYPSDLSSTRSECLDMLNNNIQTPVIEMQIKQNSVITYKEENTYYKLFTIDNPYDSYLKPIYSISRKDAALNGTIFNSFYSLSYDKKLKEYIDNKGITTSYIWGYNNTLPIIKAENVDFSTLNIQVTNAMTTAGLTKMEDILSPWLDASQRAKLQIFNTTLRNALGSKVMVYSYTYQPIYGISSQTNPNGVTTYFEYDSFGRLKLLRDNDGNILKAYDYKYYK